MNHTSAAIVEFFGKVGKKVLTYWFRTHKWATGFFRKRGRGSFYLTECNS